jgi:hypothetical protein
MFVIYDHPADFPDDIVVRKFTASDGELIPLELVYRGKNLPDARNKILGLSPNAIRFSRSKGDERQIVECWI